LRELTDEFELIIPERVKKECLAKEGTERLSQNDGMKSAFDIESKGGV